MAEGLPVMKTNTVLVINSKGGSGKAEPMRRTPSMRVRAIVL